MDNRYIPKRRKLYEIADKLRRGSFYDKNWRLDYKSMMQLFDIISRDSRAPNPHNIPFGVAIDGINNARNLLHDMGVGGSYLQRQSKLDENYNVRNSGLLNKFLPHKRSEHRTSWIDKYASYYAKYRRGESNVFVNKYENVTRNS